VIVVAMGEAAIRKIKNCAMLLLISIFAIHDVLLTNNRIFALSVDYSKHHCNHEHPKAHEVSGIFNVCFFFFVAKLFFGFFLTSIWEFNHILCCDKVIVHSTHDAKRKTISKRQYWCRWIVCVELIMTWWSKALILQPKFGAKKKPQKKI
jgi:hypothetical protein